MQRAFRWLCNVGVATLVATSVIASPAVAEDEGSQPLAELKGVALCEGSLGTQSVTWGVEKATEELTVSDLSATAWAEDFPLVGTLHNEARVKPATQGEATFSVQHLPSDLRGSASMTLTVT